MPSLLRLLYRIFIELWIPSVLLVFLDMPDTLDSRQIKPPPSKIN